MDGTDSEPFDLIGKFGIFFTEKTAPNSRDFPDPGNPMGRVLLVLLLDLFHFWGEQLHHRCTFQLSLLQRKEQEFDEGCVEDDGPSKSLFNTLPRSQKHVTTVVIHYLLVYDVTNIKF